MRNAYIHKFALGLGLSFIVGCGTGSLTTPSVTSPLKDFTLPAAVSLDNISLSNSRDILIGLRDKSVLAQLDGLNLKLQESTLISPEKQIYRLRIPPGQSLLASLKILEQFPGVRYAEPNYSFHIPPYEVWSIKDDSFRTQAYQPNDPSYGLQWNMKSAKIDQAWDITKKNANITIGVIDSGVDPNHPDLMLNLLPLEDVWNDEKGDDLYRIPGGQMVNFGGKDGNGHGTHVTGIIGAVMDNRVGVTGVVGGGIKILPIKATDYSGNTDASTLTAAFERAIANKVNVINISIGGPAAKGTQALVDVIRLAVLEKGITIVSATGNESSRFQNTITPIAVPAAYPEVIAVGAHTEFDQVASYSNGGPEIDLVAPGGGGRTTRNGEGQQIWSTWPGYPTFEFYQKRVTSTYYAATSGTSMSCPHVTGVVALMLSQEPNLTPQQIRGRLIATADDLGPPGFDQSTGYGKMNALRALKWTGHDATD